MIRDLCIVADFRLENFQTFQHEYVFHCYQRIQKSHLGKW